MSKITDIFGAVGSWNDIPPYQAQERGLTKAYELLSDGLLKQINLAVFFVVNEW